MSWFSSDVSSHEIWFEDLQGTPPPATSEAVALLRAVSGSLSSGKSLAQSIPVALQTDDAPRIVFLSVSDGRSPAKVAIGAGKGLRSAAEQALRSIQRAIPDTRDRLWIKLDVVQNVHRRDNVIFGKSSSFERSLFGMASDKSIRLAFLPEQLVAHTLIDNQQQIQPEKFAAYLADRFRDRSLGDLPWNAHDGTLYRFTTMSYFLDGEEVIPLYRGHRMFPEISKEELLSATRWGGRYLIQAVDGGGKFVYSYRPKTDDVSEKYNIVRHAGTIYAMLELYEITGEEELLRAAQRALGYLLRSMMPCSAGNNNALCVVEGGEVKLGGMALAAVALAKYQEVTGDQQHMPVLRKLCLWIRSVQDDNGEFRVHIQVYPGGNVGVFTSEYYPGEALLAFLRIYALDRDASWLDATESGAKWLINVRDKDVPDSRLNHDHWLLYALNELYQYRSNPLYFNHASRIARVIVQSQNRRPQYPDWLGSYYRPPRSTPTATRSEGLYAAYQLLRGAGASQETESIWGALQLGIAFQLQTQFRPESVLYLRDPQRALGGFRRSLTKYEIRIDYVQHNISSLLAVYRLLEKSNKKIVVDRVSAKRS